MFPRGRRLNTLEPKAQGRDKWNSKERKPKGHNRVAKACCANCGARITEPDLSDGKLCVLCTWDLRESIVASMNQLEPAHCILTVKDVATKLDADHISVGDIFFSEGSLVFVPRGSREHNSALLSTAAVGAGVAAGMPGIPIAIGMWMIDQDKASKFQNSLEKALKEDHGLSIEDRIRRRGGFVIPRIAVRSVSSDDRRHVLTVNRGGGEAEFLVGDASEDRRSVERWLAGCLPAGPDTLGLALANTPPERIVRIVVKESRGGILSERDRHNLGSFPVFTKEMYKELRVLDGSALAAAIPLLLSRWENARDVLRARIRRDILGATAGMLLGSLFLLAALAGGFGIIRDAFREGWGIVSIVFPPALALWGCLVFDAFVIKGHMEFQKYRRLSALLNALNQDLARPLS